MTKYMFPYLTNVFPCSSHFQVYNMGKLSCRESKRCQVSLQHVGGSRWVEVMCLVHISWWKSSRFHTKRPCGREKVGLKFCQHLDKMTFLLYLKCMYLIFLYLKFYLDSYIYIFFKFFFTSIEKKCTKKF